MARAISGLLEIASGGQWMPEESGALFLSAVER
jgi:hypothetical protein